MTIGRLGVWFLTNNLTRDQLVELAQTVERHGYSALWYPEALPNKALAYESLSLGGFLLSRTERLTVASGIANIYARDATAAMQGHNTLNIFYDGRFILGLGVSHSHYVQDGRGHVYGKPVATMRAYLETMYAPALQIRAPERAVVVAALGPRMLALAAEMTDGALTYNVTPEHTNAAREILGPDRLLCVEQKICLTQDVNQARRVAAEQLARYLAMPNYRNNWLRLGFSEADFEGRGSDRLLDAVVVSGSETDIERRLKAHFDAGADHMAIQPFDPDGKATPDWAALAAFAPAG